MAHPFFEDMKWDSLHDSQYALAFVRARVSSLNRTTATLSPFASVHIHDLASRAGRSIQA
jgi:hypothetical protein